MNFEINGKGALYDVNDGNDDDHDDDHGVEDDKNSCVPEVRLLLPTLFFSFYIPLSKRVSLGRSREGFASLAAFAR